MHEYISLPTIWLLIGLVLIILEITQVSGLGFLFCGLGAISTGAIISFYPSYAQYNLIIFGLFSFTWFICLWRLINYRNAKNFKNNISNLDIVGKKVKIVSDSISPHGFGKVKWSGVLFNARIIDNHEMHKGQLLSVISIEGNVLVCCADKKVRVQHAE